MMVAIIRVKNVNSEILFCRDNVISKTLSVTINENNALNPKFNIFDS